MKQSLYQCLKEAYVVATKKNDYYDGYEGLENEIKKSKVTLSQCADCKSNIGFDECDVFGKKPYKYASALAKVQCPERKEK